jgi:hypothetical protein
VLQCRDRAVGSRLRPIRLQRRLKPHRLSCRSSIHKTFRNHVLKDARRSDGFLPEQRKPSVVRQIIAFLFEL